ncbi:MAG: FHA domain-containing protein [Gemmatimonadales bacterium]
MMELEIGGERHPIPTGELVLGADPSCGLRLSGIAAAHAVVVGAPNGSISVRRVGDHDVLLNGMKLGADPAPVMHGDKIQVGIHELLVHDPRRSGSTQFVNASDVAKMVAATAKAGAPKPATAATGGRLVCLTDGREYTIGVAPMVLGREAGCDIVVPNKDVSRRHAEIFSSPQGYVLVDSSTNGTFVNGERIEAQRVLARADVLRVGDHEFRFYADRAADPVPAPAPPPPPPPSSAAPVEAATPIPPAPALPSGAAERLSHTMHGMPVPPPPPPQTPAPAPPVVAPKPVMRSSGPTTTLATFLVRSGTLKGQRLMVRVPVVNVGRAEYNDIVVPDDSVSSTHAKLQRREGIWVLTDTDSTNGTWVDGERLQGEAILGPGAVVRFGEISVMFEPTDEHLGMGGGSGTKVMGAIKVPGAPMPAASPAPSPAPVAASAATPTPAVPIAATPVPPVAPLAPPPMVAPVAPAAPVRPTPALEPALSKSGSRRPVMVSTPPPRGLPSWVIPAVLVVILAIVAFVVFSRTR